MPGQLEPALLVTLLALGPFMRREMFRTPGRNGRAALILISLSALGAAWLVARSGEKRPAPAALGNDRNKPGADAPGTYVTEP